ncbi:MAG: DUF3623 family protein, partial [Henriciella sp.]|uniref:DUF3623 family protein n=1 Tax=Henriciella sp. TaxID=1968823 RepID=UPI003C72BAE7
MIETFAPILIAVLAWWASTGVLIWLVGRGDQVRRAAAIGLSVLALGATLAVFQLRSVDTIGGAYAGFAAGILMWAWHEAMLLFGYISGPRRTPCPPGLKGWDRFSISAQA